MEFKEVFLTDLKPAAYNPRKRLKPGDPAYEQIKASIEEFGYVDPLIINLDGTIISGHQRFKVLKDMGVSAAKVVVVDVDKTKEKAMNLALNKVTGSWDVDLLKKALVDLQLDKFDLDITGFSEIEVQTLTQAQDLSTLNTPAPPPLSRDDPTPVSAVMAGLERPEFTPDATTATADTARVKNANYFVIEYYEDDQQFQTLVERLQYEKVLTNSHDIDANWFFSLVTRNNGEE
jgi:hypothetical protein